MDETTRFVARYKPWRATVAFILALGLIAAGIWLLSVDPDNLSGRNAGTLKLTSPWLQWLMIAFGVGRAIIWSRNIFDKRPQLVVNEAGLYWRRHSECVIP